MPLTRRVVAALAVLVLTGCAAPQEPPAAVPASTAPPASTAAVTPTASPSPSASESAAPTRTPSSAPAEVPAVLKFTSTTVDDRPFDGATLAGKPVLLWFWAPWCPTCRSQTKQVQAVARDHEGKVNVIGVGSLDDAKAIEAFAADAPGMTHLSDADGSVFRHFEVTQQSSFVLLDAKGDKVWSVGYGGSDDLADRVTAVAG